MYYIDLRNELVIVLGAVDPISTALLVLLVRVTVLRSVTDTQVRYKPLNLGVTEIAIRT